MKLRLRRAWRGLSRKFIGLFLLQMMFFNFSMAVERFPDRGETAIFDVTIKGTVIDVNGEPLPGVTVSIPGTTIGTATDLDGQYSLTVPEGSGLVFSFIGFESQTIQVADQSIINITLSETISALDEVVVIGYGSARRSDLTGSITTINMDDIPPAANVNLMQSLRGYAAGLNVQGGAQAGDEPSFSIRGQTTLSASSQPLIVLDGVIFHGSISDINVADVQQIDVLKDASAAAIYGSRSANGVLLVTTKSGKGTEPTINFNTYYGFHDYANHPVKMMNGDQYVQKLLDYNYMQSLYSWYGKKPTSPTDQGGRPERPEETDPNVVLNVLKSEDERKNYLAGNEIDWVEQVTRTAPMSNSDLSISGGGERFSYYVSGSYTDQKGVQVNDQFKRTTLNSKVEGDLFKWLTLGLNTLYAYRDHSGIEGDMTSARNASPLASKYNESGIYPPMFNDEFLMAHPLRGDMIDNEEIRKNLFATGYAKITVPYIEGLVYDFNYSNNQSTISNNTFYPSSVYEGFSNQGMATINNTSSTDWIMNNIINYTGEFADLHRLNLTLVYTREQSQGKSSDISANRFPNELLGYNNVSFAEQSTIISGAWEESSIGYMARLNYIFNDRYHITGTFRRDGFSGFGVNNKYANFPSVSAAWTVSEEGFMAGTDWLNHLKLRLSYGENGNQGIGRYSSLSRMGLFNYAFGPSSAIGVGPTTMGNAELGWETTRSTNLGLDYILMADRISGEIDIYQSDTENVLVTRSLPGATGFNTVWTNIGKIENKGIELELRTVNTLEPIRWESRFVFALNRDEIAVLYGDGRDDIGNQWFIGEPISAIYDYKRSGGVWTEEELYSGQTHNNFYPGQFRLADLNGDNQLTPNEDRTIVGYATPNYRFSIGNNLFYKNFTLSFLFNSIQGGNGYYIQNNRALLEATSDYDYANRMNMTAIRENWTPENGVTDAPAAYNYPSVISGNYQDRSFVRLQDVSLSYRFGQNVLNNLNVRSLQAFISGKNIYTWTNWEGFDPEIGGSTQLMMRNYIVGLRLSF